MSALAVASTAVGAAPGGMVLAVAGFPDPPASAEAIWALVARRMVQQIIAASESLAERRIEDPSGSA